MPGRHIAMNGIDRRVLKLDANRTAPIVTAKFVTAPFWIVGFGIGLLVSGGCRTGESWAPSWSKFGGSNLVFGSKANDAIDPPALSFKPSDSNATTSNRDSTPLAGNAAPNPMGSSTSPPRAPYSFQEPNQPPANASTATESSLLASRGPSNVPAGPASGPAASVAGQLPANSSGIAQVGYVRPETPPQIPSAAAPLGNSVVQSPLLPSGRNPNEMREVRSIPGGSLGNPLGGSRGPDSNPLSSNPVSTPGLPSLPPPPASGAIPSGLAPMTGPPGAGSFGASPSALPSLPATSRFPAASSSMSQGLPASGLPNAGLPNAGLPAAGLPAAGLPAAGLPAAGLPAAGLSNPGLAALPGSTGPNLDPPAPSTLDLANRSARQPSQGAVNPGVVQPTSGLTAPAAPLSSTAPTSDGFRPGSVGGSVPSSGGANYRQTQHGAFPGLPAWPGAGASPSGASSNPSGQSLPPAPAPSPGSFGTPALPASSPAMGQRSTSGRSALPAFPVPGATSGQVVCDGDQCVIQ